MVDEAHVDSLDIVKAIIVARDRTVLLKSIVTREVLRSLSPNTEQ